MKAIGVGLRFPLSAFDVSPVMQQPQGCLLEAGKPDLALRFLAAHIPNVWLQ